MRVLVVVHGFPPQALGGAEIYAEEHARTLVRAFGDEVLVLTREASLDRADYTVRVEDRDGLRVAWVNNTFREIRTFEESYEHERVASVATEVIERFRPDVAHLHHLTCLSTKIPEILEARGIPAVYTLHDYWLLCHRGQLLDLDGRRCEGPEPDGCDRCLGFAGGAPVPAGVVPVLRAIERRLPSAVGREARRVVGYASGLSDAHERRGRAAAAARLAHMQGVCGHVTRFLAPSRSIHDRFIQFGIPPEHIELASYGLNHRLFTRSPGVASGRLRLGFLGTLTVSKAPHLVLEAHRQMPQGSTSVDLYGAEADYHGDASYRRVLAPLLTLHDVRVHGPQPHEGMSVALASLDVLVVPSIWPETSPLVVHEALLTGVPVVGSRIGGIPELVEDGRNGLLFNPGDVADLHRTLMRLVTEPGLLERLKAGARATPVRAIDDDVRVARAIYARCQPVDERPAPRLAAVVLNYRAVDDTVLAVSSLLASNRGADDVIVVDNDATCGLDQHLPRWGGRVTYVPAGGNLGFPEGMNLGIRAALSRGAERVLLVNSDVVVPPDCIGRLEAALDSTGPGIVGPLVLSRSSPDRVDSAGIDYHMASGRMRVRAAGTEVRGHTWPDTDVDAISGCVMLISREVFERAGLLDARFFFGFEDIDFCLRARTAGFQARLASSAVAYHEGGRSMGETSTRRLYFAARNHLLLATAHASGDSAIRRGLRALSITGFNLAHSMTAPGGSLISRVAATFRGVRDYLGGRFGADSAG